jgi:hypothetical protein
VAINPFLCWKCGAALAELPLPLSRLAECLACRAYQHVCRMCIHFDRNIPKQCREQDAEEVKEKERPNFCDYFGPNLKAYKGGDAKTAAAKTTLDSLFGGAAPVESKEEKAAAAKGKLDDLFDKK